MAEQNLVEIILKMKDQFSDAVKKAEESAKGFSQTLAGIARSVEAGGLLAGLGLGGVATALVHATKSAAELGDSLDKMRVRTGLSIEELSGLCVTAMLADSSLQDVSQSLGFLNRALVAAIQQSGDQREAFEALGISLGTLKELSGKPAQALELVAKHLLSVEDVSNRDAIAVRLLGRAAREQLPFLMDQILRLNRDRVAAIRKELETLQKPEKEPSRPGTLKTEEQKKAEEAAAAAIKKTDEAVKSLTKSMRAQAGTRRGVSCAPGCPRSSPLSSAFSPAAA